jgi:HK97 gp10 family phage protein
MAGSVVVEITYNDFPDFIRTLPERANKPVEDVATYVVQQAQSYAPIGETGQLHDNISYQMTGDGQATVICDVPYAEYVEFGTSRMAAHPFMAPAMDDGQALIDGGTLTLGEG